MSFTRGVSWLHVLLKLLSIKSSTGESGEAYLDDKSTAGASMASHRCQFASVSALCRFAKSRSGVFETHMLDHMSVLDCTCLLDEFADSFRSA